MGYRALKTKIIWKSYDQGKLMYPLTPRGATLLLAVRLLGLGFSMYRVMEFRFDVKRSLEPHCTNLLVNERSRHISSQG
jgi:hypothetical protein